MVSVSICQEDSYKKKMTGQKSYVIFPPMTVMMRFISLFMAFAFVMQMVAPLAFNKPGQGITVAKLIEMEIYGHHGAPPAPQVTMDHAAMGHDHHDHHDHHAMMMAQNHDQHQNHTGHKGHEGHDDIECALCIISVMAQHMGHQALPDIGFAPVKYVHIIQPEPVLQSFEKAYYHIGQPRAPPAFSVI